MTILSEISIYGAFETMVFGLPEPVRLLVVGIGLVVLGILIRWILTGSPIQKSDQ